MDAKLLGLKLSRRLALLEETYGRPEKPIPRGALEQVLWENVAYLVPDEKRAAAFRALKKTVGTSAKAILAAPHEDLLAVARLGGMHPEARVEKLVEIAEIAAAHPELARLEKVSTKDAMRLLRRFPGIGEPGAQKILLFEGVLAVLALESNGLRTLLRLGYGEEEKSYAATYRSVQRAVEPELPKVCDALIAAHQLLRRHGQLVCRSKQPECDECPLSAACAFFRAGA